MSTRAARRGWRHTRESAAATRDKVITYCRWAIATQTDSELREWLAALLARFEQLRPGDGDALDRLYDELGREPVCRDPMTTNRKDTP